MSVPMWNGYIETIEQAGPDVRSLLQLLGTQVEAIQREGKADYEGFWRSVRETVKIQCGIDRLQRLQDQFGPEQVIVLGKMGLQWLT